MSISLQGYTEGIVTLKGTGAVGALVKMSGSGAVTETASGENFCGVITSSHAGYTGVQLNGYVKLPYTGTAPTVGYAKLTADTAGKVKTATAGREYLVVTVDTAAALVGFILQ